MPILEFNVIDPPTADEVAQAYKSLETGGLLSLTLLSQQEVPRPEPVDVQMRVRMASYSDDGTLDRLAGQNTEQHSIIVSLSKELGQQATAHVVVPA